MTVVGIVTFLALVMKFNIDRLIIALWPIWGFATPVIMFVLFMSYTMALVFLPDGVLGTLIFWTGIVMIATVSHMIPHDPASVFNTDTQSSSL